MKVVYLTWGETPRSYGVFGSQVIKQFSETYKLFPEGEFYFVSAVPILHSGLVREKLSYFKELKKVKNNLQGIQFCWLPVYASQHCVNSTQSTFWLMHFAADYHLKNIVTRILPDIVHCRSYHAAWAALQVRERYGFSYRVIFDGRGLWPEEVAFKRDMEEGSNDLVFLKNIEQFNLEHADVSIAVSDTMCAHYKRLGARKVQLIYLSAPTDKLTPAQKKQRNGDKPIEFCYLGALSDDTWHSPGELLELYKNLRSKVGKVKLLIITTSNHKSIKQIFSGYSDSEVVVTSTKSVYELNELLKYVDFGVISYREISSQHEALIGETMLATKTAEYLAAGLPILVNKNCGGAAALVEKYGVGVAYSSLTYDELTNENIIKLLDQNIGQKTAGLAKDLFDYRRNAERYRDIYLSLKD